VAASGCLIGQARVTPESIRPSGGTVGSETGGTNLYGPGVVAQDLVEAVGAHKDARTSPGIVDHHMALVTLEAPISTTQCGTPAIEQPIGPRLPSWFARVHASSPAAPGQCPPPLTIQSGLGHQVSVVTLNSAPSNAPRGFVLWSGSLHTPKPEGSS
jgi:hypothetical protein